MKTPLLFVTFFAAVLSAFAAEVPKMHPAEAAKLVASGKAVLVDCREAAEWEKTGVAAPAALLPKSDFDGDQKQWREFLAQNKGKQVLIYCGTGRRSGDIAAKLSAQGVSTGNVGGFKDWTHANLPTRKSDQPPAKK